MYLCARLVLRQDPSPAVLGCPSSHARVLSREVPERQRSMWCNADDLLWLAWSRRGKQVVLLEGGSARSMLPCPSPPPPVGVPVLFLLWSVRLLPLKCSSERGVRRSYLVIQRGARVRMASRGDKHTEGDFVPMCACGAAPSRIQYAQRERERELARQRKQRSADVAFTCAALCCGCAARKTPLPTSHHLFHRSTPHPILLGHPPPPLLLPTPTPA